MHSTNPTIPTPIPGRTGTGKDALIEAAKHLLPERAPSNITGRDLAAEAGVNYGLVHHYFGGKDAALDAGLRALRDDFVETHGDAATMPLLSTSDPYLTALVRLNVDAPEPTSTNGEFPIGAGLVAALTARMAERGHDSPVEAKARAIAMISVQLCVAVFGRVLFDATATRADERDAVHQALASLYDGIALFDHGQPTGAPAADTDPRETT